MIIYTGQNVDVLNTPGAEGWSPDSAIPFNELQDRLTYMVANSRKYPFIGPRLQIKVQRFGASVCPEIIVPSSYPPWCFDFLAEGSGMDQFFSNQPQIDKLTTYGSSYIFNLLFAPRYPDYVPGDNLLIVGNGGLGYFGMARLWGVNLMSCYMKVTGFGVIARRMILFMDNNTGSNNQWMIQYDGGTGILPNSFSECLFYNARTVADDNNYLFDVRGNDRPMSFVNSALMFPHGQTQFVRTTDAPVGFTYPKFDRCLWFDLGTRTLITTPNTMPPDVPVESRDANPRTDMLNFPFDVYALIDSAGSTPITVDHDTENTLVKCTVIPIPNPRNLFVGCLDYSEEKWYTLGHAGDPAYLLQTVHKEMTYDTNKNLILDSEVVV